ncbi:hypothetical protein [Wolbachia endosymbiont of Ctenocephalides felis wCfeT]|uniref:hypothetical protein n=1 Tax=Wolbachia endosymbiont of Ctenocephalides felis wCfeT TaxID=2732593 RepID=UPI0014465C73|nr:hypothetical protein [Wolbachia endosymbiont of Ctenocephalides felis wCfeT]
MPKHLRGELETVFSDFLLELEGSIGQSGKIKALAKQVNRRIDKAEKNIKALKKGIVEKFKCDDDFRNQIYSVIKETIDTRNKRNIHSPEDQKALLSIEDLLKEENSERLHNDIEADLKPCALILNPNLSGEDYDNTYNPKVIKDSFLNSKDLYKSYLEAINNQKYFIFLSEIPILASLANIEINVHYKNNYKNNGSDNNTVFKPNLEMINEDYQQNNELWGNKERETICLKGEGKGAHYERAEVITQQQQEQEDFLPAPSLDENKSLVKQQNKSVLKQQQEYKDFALAKKLQVNEILDYFDISKDSSDAQEVKDAFNELLVENANGEITYVVDQLVSGIEERIKQRSEEQKPLSLTAVYHQTVERN